MDTRRRYPNDLTDREWSQVERFIPAPKSGGRPAKYERREIVNALLYIDRTGCQWRALPQDFPPWEAVYWYFRNWKKDRTLDRLHDELPGRPAHRCGTAAATVGRRPGQPVGADDGKGGPKGYDGGKWITGRKRHILVDTAGLILAVVVHAANIQDYDGLKLVFQRIRGRFSRLRLVWADGIYKRLVGWVARWRPACPIRLQIVERTEPGFKLLKRRWVVERTFAWLGRCRRLSKDYEGKTHSSEAWVKLAMIHLMARRLVRNL